MTTLLGDFVKARTNFFLSRVHELSKVIFVCGNEACGKNNSYLCVF